MKQILDLSKNNDYRCWVKELKQRYLSARLKASIDANRTLLEYYWSLGRDIADKQYANTYGSGLNQPWNNCRKMTKTNLFFSPAPICRFSLSGIYKARPKPNSIKLKAV